MDAPTLMLLALGIPFIFSGLLLFVFFAIVAIISATDPDAHSDLLLDGEDFDRKNDSSLGGRA